ncbi:MAG: glutathione transferase GstA [Gammaproteobacteria bacterium]|nr:glutathione transferase GstA [Gammaproteobacteria bacterium]
MKLYFTPGACSMAPHIVLREAGLQCELQKVDLSKHQTDAGEDYYKINPKGYVPALRLDNGELLTEVAVILQYLADQKPGSSLSPRAGTMDHYRVIEWLNFISSEVHKQFGPMFNPKITAEWKQNQISALGRRFDYLSERLDGNEFLFGGKFTIADAYLFTILNWTGFLNIDLGKWPLLRDYMAHIAARPAVQEAMKEEGLLK